MQNKLLPCPFCGDKAELFEDEPRQFYVGCTNPDCKVEAFLPFSKTREIAIEHWNVRKPMEQIVERLEDEIEDEVWRGYEERVIEKSTLYGAIEIVKGGVDNAE